MTIVFPASSPIANSPGSSPWDAWWPLGSLFTFVGGEFMPALEEGNLWIRATMQQDISFQAAANIADELRTQIGKYPEVTQVVSQMGRPDDGTDVSTFNNVELSVALKPPDKWRPQFHQRTN